MSPVDVKSRRTDRPLLGVLPQEPPHLQGLGRPQEVLQPVLLDPHLAVVHELEQAGKIPLGDVPQDDDRMLAGVRLEKRIKRNLSPNIELKDPSPSSSYSFKQHCQI